MKLFSEGNVKKVSKSIADKLKDKATVKVENGIIVITEVKKEQGK